MKNYSITIETGEHAGETVWVHRSIAVAGFIFCRINNEWCVLANQRGEGAPDFQGYWNCPCGYLDFDETLAEACSREIYEETGVKIEPSALYMCSVNDDPKDSNRQNVTMRFMAVVDESHIGISTNAIKGQLGGEENEVKAIMWVKMSDLDNYQWAFNHRHLIEGIFYTYVDYEETECPPCILCIYHMFSEPRFRVGVAGQDGFYHVDMVDELNADLCEDDDPYTIDDCPIVHYVGGFETDRDRDSAMTNASSEDIAFIRSKSKWDSGTAENILRRHTMKYLNPSFYGQQ